MLFPELIESMKEAINLGQDIETLYSVYKKIYPDLKEDDYQEAICAIHESIPIDCVIDQKENSLFIGFEVDENNYEHIRFISNFIVDFQRETQITTIEYDQTEVGDTVYAELKPVHPFIEQLNISTSEYTRENTQRRCYTFDMEITNRLYTKFLHNNIYEFVKDYNIVMNETSEDEEIA